MTLRVEPNNWRQCLALSLALLTVTACQSEAQPPSKEQLLANPKVQALLEKTKANMRFVEGGSFQMGDIGLIMGNGLPFLTEPDNKPVHKVTLDSFSMSAYKTSYEDFDVYTEAMGLPKVGQEPVVKMLGRVASVGAGVNWHQARGYCQWLGSLLNWSMDLATEAQWEYAARNKGDLVLFATDNGKLDVGRNVWKFQPRRDFAASHGLDSNSPSLILGLFPPTPLGLYDMLTEGYEWTLDWYDPDYYKSSPELNPKGPDQGVEKVLRSIRSADASGLRHGQGMTFTRYHREPNPPKINILTGEPDPNANRTYDTTARCVVNSPKPLNDWKPAAAATQKS